MMTDLLLSIGQPLMVFTDMLLTMGLPAIDESLMHLLEAMDKFPKSPALGSAISLSKMLGLLLALCMGSYECWMMMLGRRGMDVMKLFRIVGLSLCITYSSYICESLKMPGKGLEEVAKTMADDKNKEVADRAEGCRETGWLSETAQTGTGLNRDSQADTGNRRGCIMVGQIGV